MTPWKPEANFGSFHDERRLTDEEIRLFERWSEAGAPEGDPGDPKPGAKFPEGWKLGAPDIVLKDPEPFEVPAGGRDVYRCFVIPIPIDAPIAGRAPSVAAVRSTSAVSRPGVIVNTRAARANAAIDPFMVFGRMPRARPARSSEAARRGTCCPRRPCSRRSCFPRARS